MLTVEPGSPIVAGVRMSCSVVSSNMWLCYCVAGLSDVGPIPYRRGRPPKCPKYTDEYRTKSAGAPTTVTSVPQDRSTNTVQLSSPKTGDAALKTVVKGNIMYKRTESGEVIASVIRNGPRSTVSAAASANQGRPSPESRATASLCVAGETNLPTDCPVNEANVERILDESITATQSMRRTLVSLKDDLRRMGGGAVMSPTLKPIHLQHRINIAYKLSCAFADYRRTINAVSCGRSASSTVRAIGGVKSASSTTIPSSHAPPCSLTKTPRVVPPIAVSVVKSTPVTSPSQRGTTAVTSSQENITRPTSDTALKQTSTNMMKQTSSDMQHGTTVVTSSQENISRPTSAAAVNSEPVTSSSQHGTTVVTSSQENISQPTPDTALKRTSTGVTKQTSSDMQHGTTVVTSSQENISQPTPDTALKQTSTDMLHVISDDLLMSCETDHN